MGVAADAAAWAADAVAGGGDAGRRCTHEGQCADRNPCTIDECLEGTCSWTWAQNGVACDDDRFCTIPGVCLEGVCQGVAANQCDDYDTCTADTCDELGDACRHQLVPKPGDEGPPGAPGCGDGVDNDCDRQIDLDDVNCRNCVDPAECDDGSTCTADSCVGQVCVNAAVIDGTLCDDGDTATPRDLCLLGLCTSSRCGDGFIDEGAGERCDDGNLVAESCLSPPPGSCNEDCSLPQDLCGNQQVDGAEACDDGNASSMDGCTTSCTANDRGVGAPCTCQDTPQSSCRTSNPTAGAIIGCDGLSVPPGAELGCLRSGTVDGASIYFSGGFCTAFASRCSPSVLCWAAGIPIVVGDYAAFVGPCPSGSLLVEQEINALGMTLETRSCQRLCQREADCRWNEYDVIWNECGGYRCVDMGDGSGRRVCLDVRVLGP